MTTAPDLRDTFESAPAGNRERVFSGKVWDIVAEDVDLGGDRPLRREYVDHPGAVSVLALDDEDRVLLISQYRHPVRMRLWELPAGLLDHPGEDPALAAARELWEEADLEADEFRVLLDYFNSPGGSDEAHRIYLARGVREAPAEGRHQRSEEEAGIVVRWVPLDEAVTAVLEGHLHNTAACSGVLAAAASRAAGWSTLRPADSPWPEHPDRRIT